MPHFEMAECPVCRKTAYGRANMEAVFGFISLNICVI